MKHLPFPVIFLLILSLLLSLSYSYEYPLNGNQNKRTTIYIVSHKWHSGIVLPAFSLDFLPFVDKNYVEVGWGDAVYYRSAEPSVADAFTAAFFSKGAAVHSAWFDPQPADYFPDSQVVEIRLTDKEMNRLIGFIDNSFIRDKRGNPVLLGKGLYGESRFYMAEGDFNLFYNCNGWVAEALHSSGYPISPEGIFTSDELSERLRSSVFQRTGNKETIP